MKISFRFQCQTFVVSFKYQSQIHSIIHRILYCALSCQEETTLQKPVCKHLITSKLIYIFYISSFFLFCHLSQSVHIYGTKGFMKRMFFIK